MVDGISTPRMMEKISPTYRRRRGTPTAECFPKLALSYDAAVHFWKVLLEGYSQLQIDPAGDDEELESHH